MLSVDDNKPPRTMVGGKFAKTTFAVQYNIIKDLPRVTVSHAVTFCVFDYYTIVIILNTGILFESFRKMSGKLIVFIDFQNNF